MGCVFVTAAPGLSVYGCFGGLADFGAQRYRGTSFRLTGEGKRTVTRGVQVFIFG